ncbi:hypothetical protein HZB05_00910 [Candidatus Wolfebacteria bacterium]|nr:hypothetical protein [Candidatus Wolfebacteria bacterium]
MLRPFIIAVLVIFVLAVGFQLFLLFQKNSDLNAELAEFKKKTDFFNKENSDLNSQIDFLSRWENLEKELKSKFNYRKVGEKMMIIVP